MPNSIARGCALAAALTFMACGSVLQLPYPAADYPAADEALNVRVLAVGAADAPLRYQGEEGATATVKAIVHIDMESDPPALGWFVLTMNAEIDHVITATDGDAITYESTFTDISGQGDGLMVVAGGLIDALKGVTGSATMDGRGVQRAPMRFDGANTTLLDTMEQGVTVGAPVLPEEAVGPGGRWVVLETRAAGGALVRVATTYTFKSLDGTRATFAFSEVGVGPSQQITSDGVTLAIERLETVGRGTITLDIANPFDRAGTLAHSIRIVGEARGGGEVMDYESVTKTTLKSGD